jgi:hypothetical protein
VEFSSGDSLARSFDGGMTFQKEYIEKKGLWRATKYKDYDGYSVYMEGFTQFEDYVLFYKVIDNHIVDTLMRIDDLVLQKVYDYEDKLLILHKETDEDKFIFYLTDTGFKNPKIVYSFNYNTENRNTSSFTLRENILSKEGIITILMKEITRDSIGAYSFNLTKGFRIESFDAGPELIFNEPVSFYNYGVALNEDKILSVGIQDTNTLELDYYFCKFKLDDGFDYEILGKMEEGVLKVYHAMNDNSMFFYNKQGHFWKPIEEDRIPTNVVEENRPPAIWTYPPYPNPAVDQTKIQFYSGVMSDVNSLQLKVVNISTGQEIKGLDYSITANNNWNGTLNLDTGKFPTGSYLLEFKLGDRTTTEKLIIAR